MFKLSYQLLISRKKWFLLLVVVFSLIISSVISIFTATNTIKSSLFYKSFQQYGEFSGVLYNLSEKKDDIIKSKIKVGHFVIINSLKIKNNKSASIGWVDQDFINIGHIKLISGSFPTNNDEVAIESYYLESIDSKWKIGESRTINIENESKLLKLVGIVKNYSTGWTTGAINFPNLLVSKSTASLYDLKNNYLIGINHNYNMANNITNTEILISNYHRNGFLNSKLFYKGLKDIDNITLISFSIQLVILLMASLSILSMLSYFNINQMTKFATFRALGCTNKKLFLITVKQTLFIYVLGIILSTPLLSLFHYIIIKKTYNYNLPESNMSNLIIGAIAWLVLLFILITLLSYVTIKNQSKNSISNNLKGSKSGPTISTINQVKRYSIKQLIIQLLSNPRNTILTILTLTFSILIVLLSFTMANESAGIWNTKIDYFLTSQECIGTKLINGKTVVVTKGETFDPSEVRKIENLVGVKYVDKNPFMIDVFPIFKKEMLTSSLVTKIKKYNKGNNYNVSDEAIISNIKYVFKSEEYITKSYLDINEDKLQNSIIIYIPGLNNNEKAQLKGKEITLTKTYISNNSYITKNWDFTILDVINAPYTVEQDDGEAINKVDEITIIMTENAALDKGITQGYKDLIIYIDESISKESANIIYNKVYSLSAGIPGSLFQYIPDVIFDQTRITDYLKFMGRLAFYISIILAVSSINIVILGKYKAQKRNWGIYRTLGMSVNKVFLYLLLEILVIFTIALLISSTLYFAFLFLYKNLTYPLLYYIIFMTITIMFIFFMLIASSIFMKKRVKHDSIASLLRIVE